MPGRVRSILIFGLLFVVTFSGVCFAEKSAPLLTRLQTGNSIEINPKNVPISLRTADTCVVYEGGNPYYMTYPWVEGDELFKAYQNPGASCDTPYPFSIDRIHVIFYIVEACSIVLSGDIELVDNSTPSCPHPGEMLTLTDGYEYEIPSADLYSFTVPLDSPIVVNGPYFVGLYIAPNGSPGSIAVVTDSIPVGCASYNDWGYGYVDLDTVYTNPDGNGLIKAFEGRMILYSSGTTGGTSGGDTEPEPAAEFISPSSGQFIGQSVDLWANDAAGSSIIERADFAYNYGGSWTNIGSDLSDDPPLRNGVIPSGTGNGLSYQWYPAGLPDGNYQLRAIITDTLGRADTALVTVTLDPTPPNPQFTQPTLGQDVCDGINAQITCSDEDLNYLTFETKDIASTTILPIPIINQNLGGDANGNSADGNPASGGEFGDYCSGPAAAAMAVKYWSGKDYSNIIKEGVATLTDAQLIDRMFEAMKVADNLGSYDEEFVSGLNQYLLAHGGGFALKINRSPLAKDLYTWGFNYDYCTMVGLSGDPGRWMVLSGITGCATPDGAHIMRFADPATAAAAEYSVKEEFGKLWVEYFGQWYEIDAIVGLVPTNWSAGRINLGFDGNGADGWGLFWNTSSLSRDMLHFLHAAAFDISGHNGFTSVLVKNECGSGGYTPGDVNNDGAINPGDLVYLINFIYLNQSPPPAGNVAANINGDNSIDITDVMYLYRYLFMGGPAPH